MVPLFIAGSFDSAPDTSWGLRWRDQFWPQQHLFKYAWQRLTGRMDAAQYFEVSQFRVH